MLYSYRHEKRCLVVNVLVRVTRIHTHNLRPQCRNCGLECRGEKREGTALQHDKGCTQCSHYSHKTKYFHVERVSKLGLSLSPGTVSPTPSKHIGDTPLLMTIPVPSYPLPCTYNLSLVNTTAFLLERTRWLICISFPIQILLINSNVMTSHIGQKDLPMKLISTGIKTSPQKKRTPIMPRQTLIKLDSMSSFFMKNRPINETSLGSKFPVKSCKIKDNENMHVTLSATFVAVQNGRGVSSGSCLQKFSNQTFIVAIVEIFRY